MAARNKRGGGSGGSFESEWAATYQKCLNYPQQCCRDFIRNADKIKRRRGTKGGQASIRRALLKRHQAAHSESEKV